MELETIGVFAVFKRLVYPGFRYEKECALFRKLKSIPMPLENSMVSGNILKGRVLSSFFCQTNLIPANFFFRRFFYLCAEGFSEKLRPEANPKKRNLFFDNFFY